MFTRTQYLNKEVSHDEYYAQFVTEHIKNIVLRNWSKATLQIAYAENEHFSVIPIKFWDMLANSMTIYAEPLCQAGESDTLSTRVCILKAAARQIINE
jgi:hypothetical protein